MENELYEVIDAHTHVFPDKIAEKSQIYVGDFYQLPMYTCGTYTQLKKVSQTERIIDGKKFKIVRQLICSPAVTGEQTGSINRFIGELVNADSSLIGFGTLHPDNENYAEIIREIKESGLKGIKFHSDFQRFNIDDKVMFPIYGCAEQEGLPVLLHMGDKKYDYSSPLRLTSVVEAFPNLKIIAAHMGGYSHWDEAYQLPVSENLYFDASSSLSFLSENRFLQFVEKFGVSHFFFGSDFPMWDPYGELEKFMKISMDEKTRKAILYDNFAAFMGDNKNE